MKSFLKYLLFLRHSLMPLTVLTLTSLVMASLILFLPAMQKLLFDRLFVTMDVWLLIKFCVFSILLTGCDVILHTIYTLYATDIQSKLSNSIKRNLVQKLFRSSYQFLTSKGSGFFIKRIVEDAPIISRGIIHTIHLLNSVVLIAAIGLIVYFINPWLLKMFLILIAVSIACTLILTIPSVILNGKVGHGYSDLSDLCYGIFPGVADIKANNLIGVVLQKMHAIHTKMKQRFLIYSIFCTLQWQVASIIPRVGYALLLIHGLASVESGTITIGTFYGLISMLWVMFDPLEKLFYHYSFFHGAIMAVRRTETIQEAPNEIAGTHPFPSLTEGIRLDNISYSYNEESLLNSLSMHIPAGSDIAIVGETGCGKSTLAQLLLRIYDGYSGKIHFDGGELEKWEIHSLRDNLLYIPATVPLFPLSIEDNIDIHNKLSTSEMQQIIQKVNLTSVIASLPDGMATIYRDDVADLSGGEKQRIALGRCFTSNAQVLILDEATSALDEENESTILKQIKKEYEGRTIIRISHKLSAIKDCDRIFVLKEGQIVEEGTLEELEEKSGEFCRLFNRAG